MRNFRFILHRFIQRARAIFFQQIVAANGAEIMEEIKCNLSVWVISLLSYESRRQMMATIIPYCCYTAPPRISLRACCCFSNCCFIASFCSIVLMIIRVELFKYHGCCIFNDELLDGYFNWWHRHFHSVTVQG